jgi:membrane protein
MARAPAAEAGSGRGRDAQSPRRIPPRGWIDILRRVKGQISRDRLSIVAAGVAFYALLAIFPGLLAIVALYGLFSDAQQVEAQFAAVSGFLPPQASEILLDQLHDLVETDQAALGAGAVIGVVLALWSASSGVRNLMEALNVVYGERERRGFLRFYGTALLLTIAAIVGVAIAMTIVVAVPMVVRFLGLGSVLGAMVDYARWPVVAATVMLGLAVIYRYGPSRDRPRWAWVAWGAGIATLLWLAGSALFSLYVTQFGNFNKTYGSAGAIVVLLMWFLVSAYAVLIGGEINAEMERQTRRDTTEGEPEPLGERGAHAADTLGTSR